MAVINTFTMKCSGSDRLVGSRPGKVTVGGEAATDLDDDQSPRVLLRLELGRNNQHMTPDEARSLGTVLIRMADHAL